MICLPGRRDSCPCPGSPPSVCRGFGTAPDPLAAAMSPCRAGSAESGWTGC